MKKIGWFVPVFALVACGSSANGSADGASAVVVNPSGTDKPGAIQIVLPDALNGASVGALWVDQKVATVGQVVDQLAVGKHTVVVNGCSTSVDVQAATTSTVTLGAVRFKAPAESTLGLTTTSADPHLAFGANATLGDFRLVADKCNQAFVHLGAPSAVIAGTYSAGWGFGDGTDAFTVGEGVMVDVDLGSPSGRRMARIVAPASRDRPDPEPQNDLGVDGEEATYGNAGWGVVDGDQHVRLPAVVIAPAPGSALVIGTRSPTKKLSFSLPFVVGTVPLDLDTGSMHAYSIGRIDVTNVTVSLGDGTTRLSPGNWTLSNASAVITYFNFAQGETTGGAPTEHGIDVWPGTYTLTTQYTTAEAGMKTDTKTVVVQ